MREPSGRLQSGFSLVELLVVIGIIALLAGFLVPAIVGARQKAQSVQCASNLRQIGIALEAFNQEHRRLPDATPSLSSTLAEMKACTRETFLCPASGAERNDDYQLNGAFAGLPKSAGNAADMLAREIADMSTGSGQKAPEPQSPSRLRHRGGLNVLYFDGRVDAVPQRN
jgi:prepilin-type N-terminal cleavage/methylation domain-containing protein/prepilin-type processing-associated H-X9-DG protein